MGRLLKNGQYIAGKHSIERFGLILGTGWSDPEVLASMGFECESTIPFGSYHLDSEGKGAGHPNKFLIGTWHGQDVVISQGRLHGYQEQHGQPSLIRKWMSIMLALMGNSRRLVITSSVGGVSDSATTGTVVQPTELLSAHLPMSYLNGSEGEFVMSGPLIWNVHYPSGLSRMWREDLFLKAAEHADLKPLVGASHVVIPGPGYGGRFERELWKSWNIDTVGMSLDPELRLIALENMDNNPTGDEPENNIVVFAAFIVTDDHDLPNHAEITAAAKARAPQLGAFLSTVVESQWGR
jgi:purine nucleoside phosphorylase